MQFKGITYLANAMITPKSNFLITGFFKQYIGWIIRRNFQAINYNTPAFDSKRSVLLIANHFSWWDGFLLYCINKRVFKKQFHIMVLEETIKKFGFLKYLGAFSVVKHSRQVVESINYAAGLLNNPDNVVVIFPQGKLYSNFTDAVDFEQGAARIAAQAGVNFQYVFAAAFVENFEYKKPTVNMYLTVLNVDAITPGDLQAAYQQHYTASKKQQTAITVE